MGILKNGLTGHVQGKIDGLVFYTRLGKNVSRKQATVTKPASPLQAANRLKMGVVSKFLTPVLQFTNLGFRTYKVEAGGTAYNRATSEVKLNGLKGVYPDTAINFETIKLSKGKLTVAEGVSLEIVPSGIAFKWALDPEQRWPDATDQAMLLVYFPEEEKALHVLYGPQRSLGAAILPVSTPMLTKEMHLFISFISADRNDVSESVYAGSLNLS
ncbi:MAG: DUF6266 family protein [Pedobacter sp.]